jgi:glc operon protein GlcG
MTISASSVSLDEGLRIAHAAHDAAKAAGIAVAVVVLDAGGNVKCSTRMDGAPLMALSMAEGKAYTAVGMGVDTSVWEQAAAVAPSFAGSITSVPRFTPFGGGLPLTVDGDLIGSVGVSGGTVDQDLEVVAAAAQAL